MQGQWCYDGPDTRGTRPTGVWTSVPVEGGGAHLSSVAPSGYTGTEASFSGTGYRAGQSETPVMPVSQFSALPGPHPASSSSFALPQLFTPFTDSTTHMSRRASTQPMIDRPEAATAPPAATDRTTAAALVAFHRELVAYYWHYAQQGYVAPLTAPQGTEEHQRQVAARTEAVQWARQCGIVVVEPSVPQAGMRNESLSRTPGLQAEGRSQGTASRPLTPALSVSAPSLHQSSAPAPLPARSTVDETSQPAPLTSTAPHASLARSASLPPSTAPLPPAPSSQATLDFAVRDTTTIPTARALYEARASASSAPLPSSSAAKRPLPLPPLSSATTNLPKLPRTTDVTERLADLSLNAGPKAVEETSFAPAVPSFSFDGPDEDEERSPPPAKPPIPSFSFGQDDGETTSGPAIPSFSFADEDGPAKPPQQSNTRPRPPPLHPRYDPSHPSHALYHPTSGGHAIPEAGTIVCTACHQPIFGRVLVALARQWHPDCFRCAEEGCGARLEVMEFEGTPEDWENDAASSEGDDDEGEGERKGSLEGRAWCMVHFEERFALECHHCRTPIASADYVPVSDPSLPPRSDYRHPSTRYYHPLHFFCAGCGDPFIDPVAYESRSATSPPVEARSYVPREGHPYCVNCDLRMWRPRCPGCQKGLREEDGFLEVEGAGRWHEGCFKCSRCAKPLTGVYLLRRSPASGDTHTDDDPVQELPHCAECYDIRAKEQAEAAVLQR
ncbi:hypothetical protein NBRC10512_003103 [Rhodotorula toruloides]|uniref:RHTO0S05e10264g1_1 n=2 Tax=Rhodotorula toruloides TaxID=5286 RepID=A0A061B1Y3_RHOTO|nr:zinc finger, LIM-type protein [Rhodotorula toruloides NP11]EMS23697.1 zinc finger, LIM-type protein [Rhodotorula toruloides NP11]CDR40981.1 RHTO0S05e10264g1_1 [Rhodotorula toruloides]